MTFSGLCAFVPEKPASGKPWTRVGVVMLRNQMEMAASNGKDGIPVHEGYVVCRLNDLDRSSSRQPNLVFGARQPDSALYFLHGEDLTIDRGKSPATFEYVYKKVPNNWKVTTDNAADLHWLADLTGFCTANSVSKAVMKSPAGLAARVILDHGLLSCSLVDKNVKWLVVPVDRGKKASPGRPLAQQVSLVFNTETLTLRSKVGGNIRFACDPGSEIVVALGVAPVADILLLSDAMRMDTDYHFELYANVIENGHPHHLARVPTVWLHGNCPGHMLAVKDQLWKPTN
jgi:hypothetical protein